MKLLSTLPPLAIFAAAVDAQRTYNATAAVALGGLDGKYRCLYVVVVAYPPPSSSSFLSSSIHHLSPLPPFIHLLHCISQF